MASPRRVAARWSLIAAVRSCTAAVMPCLRPRRARGTLLALSVAVACTDQAPPGPPYLAIVSNLYTLGGATAPAVLTYRVRETAGAYPVERTLRVAPRDTVILALPASTYQVDVEGLPTRCLVSNGTARGIVLTAEDNTGIVRYSIQCRGIVSVAVVADGPQLDSSYVYRVRHGDGTEWTGLVAANDTATLSDAGGGDYNVRLGGVAANCVVMSAGGAEQRVEVSATGGVIVVFRVSCSDLARRPQLLSLVGGFDKGMSVFTFRVWDPDADLDGYTWDLTDCRGTSVLPDQRRRVRRGLRDGRGALSDTLTVVGAYDLGLAGELFRDACTEIRVFDVRGNSSVILSHRLGSGGGLPPAVRFFNATLEGTSRVTSLLLASDPENDIVGHFVLVRLRDGVLGPPDGRADLGSLDAAGYLGLDVAPIPTTGRVRWDDVLAVIVGVIDARGNAIRVEDVDIFR